MSEWVNECMSEWVNEWENERMREWENEWVSECVNERMREWENECMSEQLMAMPPAPSACRVRRRRRSRGARRRRRHSRRRRVSSPHTAHATGVHTPRQDHLTHTRQSTARWKGRDIGSVCCSWTLHIDCLVVVYFIYCVVCNETTSQNLWFCSILPVFPSRLLFLPSFWPSSFQDVAHFRSASPAKSFVERSTKRFRGGRLPDDANGGKRADRITNMTFRRPICPSTKHGQSPAIWEAVWFCTLWKQKPQWSNTKYHFISFIFFTSTYYMCLTIFNWFSPFPFIIIVNYLCF